MALYYYINNSLSRINFKKKVSGGKEMYITAIYKRNTTNHGAKKERGIYSCIYIEKTQKTTKQNVIYLYIRKIQLTSGQKEKKKRDI